MAFEIKEEGCKKILINCPKESGFVEIPEGVTEIGDSKKAVFSDNENTLDYSVTGVKIPSSVKKINTYGFYRTCVDNVEFSEGLEEIGANAFRKSFTGHVNVQKEIRFPESLKIIREGAFSDTGIKKVYVGEEVIIESYAFPDNTEVIFLDKEGKESLTPWNKAFVVEEDFEELERREEETAGERKRLNNQFLENFITPPTACYKITDLKNKAISSIKLDDLITDEGYFEYVEIGNEVFNQCNLLEKVILPETIKKIGKSSFATENLKTAIIPFECSIVDEYFDTEDYKNSFLKSCDVFMYSDIWDEENAKNVMTLMKYNGTKNLVIIPDYFEEICPDAFPESVETIIIPVKCKINKEAFEDYIKVYDKKGKRVI